MKNFTLLNLVFVFVISCSNPEDLPQDEIIETDTPNVNLDFPSKEIDVLAQWTFKPNTGAKRLTKKKSLIKSSFKINQIIYWFLQCCIYYSFIDFITL